MIRFLVPDLSAAQPGASLPLPKDEAKHAKVLRVRPGEIVELLDGNGIKTQGKFSDGAVELNSVNRFERPASSLTLLIGVTQGGTFETILSQAIEMGVSRIIPLRTQNSAPLKDAKRQTNKQERWQRIVEEACKQSGQPFFPALNEVTALDESLFSSLADHTHWVGALTDDSQLAAPAQGNLAVWIGPEGDFSPSEYELLKSHGAHFLSLGENILRSQTACVAILTLAKHHLGLI